MLKRRIIMGLLVLGTIGGFASGFAGMACRAKARRAAFEQHVADVCVGAVKRYDADEASDTPRRERDADADDEGRGRRHRGGDGEGHRRHHHGDHD